MLDLQKLILQIKQVTAEHLRLAGEDTTVVELRRTFAEAASDPDKTYQRLADNRENAQWPVAMPTEPIGAREPVAQVKESYTVVGVDGSQIMPSHHEVYNCYLLNIGTTVLTYGTASAPLLDSQPHLFHRPEDLYPLVDKRRVHIDELYVSLERNLLELTTLRQLAWRAKDRGLPVVALLDGSIIPWSLDKMPASYQQAFNDTLTDVLQYFHSEKIPLIGYISHSRASDIVNSLRICRCPYEASRCRDFCGHLTEEDYPCSVIWPARDRQLMYEFLPVANRSAVFASGARMTRQLPEALQAHFCYLNVGKEISRLEFPGWLAYDNQALAMGLGAVLAQCQKGDGYPVSLAEAHNQAVIRTADRTEFFHLIERHLVDLGVDKVGTSPKEARKRQGII